MKEMGIVNLLSVVSAIQLGYVSVTADKMCAGSLESDLKWRRDGESCSTAYFCILGRPVSYTCPEGHVIGSNTRHCVPIGSEEDDCTHLKVKVNNRDLDQQCKDGVTMPSSANCAKYAMCATQETGDATLVEAECPYPMLYDVKSGKCDQYKNVQCAAGQTVPKDPCDYDANQCTSAHCVPCNVRFPSCKGREDGQHPWTGKEWTPFYVVCNEERVVLQEECKSEKEPQVFHPEKRMCVVYDEKTVFG